jgi:hypothetical protein
MVTLMAFLVKEAVENVKEKEKNVFKSLFQNIEKEINEDKALQVILKLNKIDTLDKLYTFISNKQLKEKIKETIERTGIEGKNIKISILSSSKDMQKKMNELGLEAENFLFISLAAFKNGDRIAGSVIKAMIEENGKIRKKENEINVYEVDPKEKKYEKTNLKEIKQREKLIEEEKERRKKELEFGAPSRRNPGVEGPGL